MWWTCLGVAVVCAAGTAAYLYFSSPARVLVTVQSQPAMATVFSGGAGIGVTPVTLTLRPQERVTLRLVRKDCADTEAVVDARLLPPPQGAQRFFGRLAPPRYAMTVSMRPAAEAELSVVTRPEGADVFLDGARVGTTPLSLRALQPGTHSLRLAHPTCFPHAEEIALKAGEPLRVERALESKVEAFYRDAIGKEPGLLTNYAELAHHHVVEGEFPKAVEVLRQGVAALKREDAALHARFFAEITQIYTRYYAYPPEKPGYKLRPALRALIKETMDKGLYNAKTLEGFLKQMDNYDASHP
jgi:hypothetical protein